MKVELLLLNHIFLSLDENIPSKKEKNYTLHSTNAHHRLSTDITLLVLGVAISFIDQMSLS